VKRLCELTSEELEQVFFSPLYHPSQKVEALKLLMERKYNEGYEKGYDDAKGDIDMIFSP